MTHNQSFYYCILGISNLLSFSPPLGCGELLYEPYPLLFPKYYPLTSNCYDGTNITNESNYYNYNSCGTYGGVCSFSFYDLYYNNKAARRTCSFTNENFSVSILSYVNTNCMLK